LIITWIPGHLSIEAVCVRVARINSIVRFITFERCGHSSDFGFGADARGFLSRVTGRAQEQARENENDRNDYDQLDESESGVAALVPSADLGGKSFDTNASTRFGGNFFRHSLFVLSHFSEPFMFVLASQ
jgi:hypothetical protein